jgi:hypothetical protein
VRVIYLGTYSSSADVTSTPNPVDSQEVSENRQNPCQLTRGKDLDKRERIEYETMEDPVYTAYHHPEMEIYLLTAEEIESLRVLPYDDMPDKA